MKNYDVISIPVAPHVEKFMSASFGPVYQLSKNDQIGIMILAMLSKKLTDMNPNVKFNIQNQYYQVAVSMNYFKKEGFSLDIAQKKLIGKALDLYFRDIIYSYAIMNYKCHRHEIKQSIITYCEAFNITTEEIDPETLCRDIRRKKTASSPNLITILNQYEPKNESLSAVSNSMN